MPQYIDYGFKGRVAQSVDMVRVVLFFEQENLFVSRQDIVVDGGSNN